MDFELYGFYGISFSDDTVEGINSLSFHEISD